MGFVFRLETVLTHRKSLRDLAQKDLSQAEADLHEHLQRINAMYTQVDEMRDRAVSEQRSESISPARLEDIESFILSLKRKIEKARSQSRQLMQIVEEKRDVLVEKAKDFKAIELLKEKHAEEYAKAAKVKEAKQIDDLVQMRFKKEKIS